jgi:hypothetical protein
MTDRALALLARFASDRRSLEESGQVEQQKLGRLFGAKDECGSSLTAAPSPARSSTPFNFNPPLMSCTHARRPARGSYVTSSATPNEAA